MAGELDSVTLRGQMENSFKAQGTFQCIGAKNSGFLRNEFQQRTTNIIKVQIISIGKESIRHKIKNISQ